MKTFQVSMGPQAALASAFRKFGECEVFDWTSFPVEQRRTEFVQRASRFVPDVVFCQLQADGILTGEELRSVQGFKINWTGDMSRPLPEWYKRMGNAFDVSLFGSEDDVRDMRDAGLPAAFLNIGLNPENYRPDGEIINAGDVVFMANAYTCFPLSEEREKTIRILKREFGPRFRLYGRGWTDADDDLTRNQRREAAIYRGSKIGINLSNFNADRYSSDRLLRIMGSGTMCLSHHFLGIDKDYGVGEHLDTWSTHAELVEKVSFYLANESERKRLAAAGCRLVHEQHTWSARFQNDLLPIIREFGGIVG